MKNRLHDKKAGIAILALIFIISLADIILRATIFSDIVSTITNYGEVLINALVSALLIIFALTKKDRVFYILCGAWLGCFIFNQIYSLPGLIANLVSLQINNMSFLIGNIGIILQIVSMICIGIIGGLLVEYMNDGSIYNKAFTILCIVTLLCQIFHVIIGILIVTSGDSTAKIFILAILNGLYNMAMVFLFTIFAYDSAKKQLSKVNFDK